jgi:hypothetical protein
LVFRFVDLLGPGRVVRVLGSYSEEVLEEQTTGYPDGFSGPHEIEWGPRPFFLALRDLTFLGGRPSESAEHGSKVTYWFEGAFDGYGFKGYTTNPEDVTSSHWHLVHWERIYRAGNGNPPILRLGRPTFREGEKRRELRKSCPIPIGVEHQLVAGTVPDLIVVAIEGPDPLGMGDHHYANVG